MIIKLIQSVASSSCQTLCQLSIFLKGMRGVAELGVDLIRTEDLTAKNFNIIEAEINDKLNIVFCELLNWTLPRKQYECKRYCLLLERKYPCNLELSQAGRLMFSLKKTLLCMKVYSCNCCCCVGQLRDYLFVNGYKKAKMLLVKQPLETQF